MTAVTRSVQLLVQRPLRSTFDYVSNLELHPEWNEGLKIEALTEDAIGVGKEYASRGKVAVQENRPNVVRVSQYDPPHLFAFIANDPNFGDVSHEFRLTEQGDNVLITRTMALQLNPVIAVLFRSIVYPLIGRPSMEKSFADLKKRLESS
jgi:uncharacterized protein YndB with AHSA1/START domain